MGILGSMLIALLLVGMMRWKWLVARMRQDAEDMNAMSAFAFMQAYFEEGQPSSISFVGKDWTLTGDGQLLREPYASPTSTSRPQAVTFADIKAVESLPGDSTA